MVCLHLFFFSSSSLLYKCPIESLCVRVEKQINRFVLDGIQSADKYYSYSLPSMIASLKLLPENACNQFAKFQITSEIEFLSFFFSEFSQFKKEKNIYNWIFIKNICYRKKKKNHQRLSID